MKLFKTTVKPWTRVDFVEITFYVRFTFFNFPPLLCMKTD